MNSWVVVHDGSHNGDGTVYPTDTAAEVEIAARALAENGERSARVYVGDPDSPDCYANGQTVYAADESVRDAERCDHPRVEDGECTECEERCSRRDVGAEGPLCHDPECPIHGEVMS